jgi:hypothetical protein
MIALFFALMSPTDPQPDATAEVREEAVVVRRHVFRSVDPASGRAQYEGQRPFLPQPERFRLKRGRATERQMTDAADHDCVYLIGQWWTDPDRPNSRAFFVNDVVYHPGDLFSRP